MQESAIFLSQDQQDAVASVALNLYEQGRTTEAQNLFDGLIQLADSFYGYAGMGAIALSKEPPELDDAFGYLSKATEKNPNDPTVHANLGEVLLRQSKISEALAELKQAITLDPTGTDTGANRARAMLAGLATIAAEQKKAQAAENAA